MPLIAPSFPARPFHSQVIRVTSLTHVLTQLKSFLDVCCRGKEHGNIVRLQIHRNVRWHQSQRRRAACGDPHTNPAEAGEPGAREGSLQEEELFPEEKQEQVSPGRSGGPQTVSRLQNLNQPQGEKSPR